MINIKFDVLTDPWIPVRFKDGHFAELGVRDVLFDAPKILEITDTESYNELGIYRFLLTFLMDVYRPKTENDIKQILLKEKFDSSIIEDYISLCLAEGVSFDLFDSARPFLQCADFPNKADKNNNALKSVANLTPSLPQGNNLPFFNHTSEDSASLSVPVAVRALCASCVTSLAGTGDMRYSINGAPPIYTIIRGESLFQTLVYGMIPDNGKLSTSYADPPPVWRTSKIIAREKIAQVSLLYGLLFPSRRIRLLIGDDNLIHQIYYEPGFNFIGYDSWTDPYVAYRTEKHSNIKPDTKKENWRNLEALLDCRNTDTGAAPFVVKQYNRIADSERINLMLYSIATKQSAYNDAWKSSYTIPFNVIKTPIRFDLFQDAMKTIETQYGKLKKNIEKFSKSYALSPGAKQANGDKAMCEYYQQCKHYFLDIFCDKLSKATREELESIREDYVKEINRIRWIQYEDFINNIASSVDAFIIAEQIKSKEHRKECL